MTTSAAIVAVMAGVDDPPLFDRAPVVLAVDGQFIQVRCWGPVPTGTPLASEEVDDLVRSGQATRLRAPVPPRGRPFGWVFRNDVDLREPVEAIADGLLYRESHDQAVVLLVDEERASWVRQQLADAARDRARTQRSRGIHDAELAWLMAPVVTPEHVALLFQNARTVDGLDLANDVRAIERRSRGDAFDAEVAELLKSRSPPDGRRARTRPWWPKSQEALRADLERLPVAA